MTELWKNDILEVELFVELSRRKEGKVLLLDVSTVGKEVPSSQSFEPSSSFFDG